MKLLAVETSSNACSVAIGIDGEILDRHVVEPRAHTRILVPMISGLLGDAGIDVTELDAVVLGNGPGSFIGMRIGASVVQGICFAAGIVVVPISSLAAVAAEAMSVSDARRVVVTQDARMNEVYAGTFRRGKSALPVAVGEEVISPVDGFDVDGEACFAAGDGWNRYPDLLASAGDLVLGQIDVKYPAARFLLSLSGPAMQHAVSPERLLPSYLRHKVAEKPTQDA